ncbi:MAG: PD-(D/E)XK nuclease family protein [Archangium sp.]|nr:PD-(D/E)XK nuclease family protein [Archangium sp.]
MPLIVTSRRNELRLDRVRAFLTELPTDRQALIIAPSFETAAEVVRSVQKPVFGWTRTTLYRHALELARPTLLQRGLTAVSSLSLEALWARVAHQLGEAGRLGRLEPLRGTPGLSRALAQSINEARMLELAPEKLEPALRAAALAFDAALADVKLADRAQVYAIALSALKDTRTPPVALVDVRCAAGLERRFADELVAAAPSAIVTVPVGDPRAGAQELEVVGDDETSLLQRGLFKTDALPHPHPSPRGTGGTFFSAPGEARECVEIARRVLEFARNGVPFDRIAVFLRSPGAYRAGLEDAFRRAQIPAWFSSGLPHPDPAGRALLALLHCAEERLSARRFSEYLSLSQVPQLEESGAPPAASDLFVRPDASESMLPLEPAFAPPKPADEKIGDVEAPAVLGQLRAPRRWERLIIDAAVIGGPDRWRRRLSGLRAGMLKAKQNPTATEAQLERLNRELGDLHALEQFALPVLDLLSQLPRSARWSDWINVLSGLATRALKDPTRVLAILRELEPMGIVGPIELPEVRRVLSRRLSEVTDAPEVRRNGRVFVAPTDAARGLAFDVVFIPGLAERVFPQKIREDPLLPDSDRTALSSELEVAADRIAAERLALMVSVGAARKELIFSYPRIDAEHARPRVPSFYALEAAQAVQGQLPGFEALQRQAESAGKVRLAWPAPEEPTRAIDDTEFDLAVLHRLLHSRDANIKGQGRYLVTSSPHLARALRSRYARWQQSTLTAWDGFLKPGVSGRTALEAHHPTKRPFSPTALENYAACPYRFFLSALVKLEPLQIPGELEELGPLERGSMAHAVQYRLLSQLRKENVTVTAANLEDVFKRLDAVIREVAAEFLDDFKPAIEKVFDDGVNVLTADLREWLRKMTNTKSELGWTPAHFELAFGLPGGDADERDPRSSPLPVTLTEGLQVRGSIDLVERNDAGGLRATDYKTGKQRATEPNTLGGGRHIQPLLYALVLEKLFPEAKVVGGRLYYTTLIGGFEKVFTPLEDSSREAFGSMARTIRSALETGFFPAMPTGGDDECRFCKFRPVCGPDEERRVVKTKKAVQQSLKELNDLRGKP